MNYQDGNNEFNDNINDNPMEEEVIIQPINEEPIEEEPPVDIPVEDEYSGMLYKVALGSLVIAILFYIVHMMQKR